MGRSLSLAAAVFISLPFGAAAQSDVNLLDDLRSLAPDFEMGWVVAASDLRTRAETTQMSEAFGVFDDYEDDSYFDTDILEYVLEQSEPLGSRPALVSYAITPDHYVSNAMRDGDVTADPLIDRNSGCAVAVQTFFSDEDIAQIRAAVVASDAGAELDDQMVFYTVDDIVRSTLQEVEPIFPIEVDGLPQPQVRLSRNCSYRLEVYSQSEKDSTATTAALYDQVSAVGLHLATLDGPPEWTVRYDDYSGDESTTPLDRFYVMTYGPAVFEMTPPPGPAFADGFLTRIKFEPRPEPTFLERDGLWLSYAHLSVEMVVPLTPEDLEDLEAGTYFPPD